MHIKPTLELKKSMACGELRDRVIRGIPDTLTANFDFSATVASTCLSHHGFILGVALRSGVIFVCDSRTICNRRDLPTRIENVTASSFTRDSRWIVLGSKDGSLTRCSILDDTDSQEFKVPGPVSAIECSPKDVNVFLVLLENRLVIVRENSADEIPGVWSAAKWRPDGACILAISENGLVSLDSTDFATMTVHPFECARPMRDLDVSPDGNFVVALDCEGEASLFNLELGVVSAKVIERDNKKAAWVKFDCSGKYFYAAPQEGKTAFIAYSTSTGEKVGEVECPETRRFGILIGTAQRIVYLKHRLGVFMYAIDVSRAMPVDVPFDGTSKMGKDLKLTRDMYFGNRGAYDSTDNQFPQQIVKLPYSDVRFRYL